MTKPKKTVQYCNVTRTDKEPQRRLLNRGAIKNGLGGQKIEYPVNRVMPRNKKGQPLSSNRIDVNLNNFLPKLPDANTGNTKMRGVNPYAPEPKPITDGTSYLDTYQMKPGFHFPDVEDKIKIAARHQLQIKVVPKEIVKLEDELDNRPRTRMHREDNVTTLLSPSDLSVISYNRSDSPLNIPMPPSRRASPLYAGPPTMPHGEGTHLSSSAELQIEGALVPRPPPMSCGEGQEHAYMPCPPSMSHNEDRMYMPRPPPGPRGVRHAFMPQPPTVQREADQAHMPTVPKEDGTSYYKRKTSVKLENMNIFPHHNTQLGLTAEILNNCMPTAPTRSERNIRGQSQQKGGGRKTLPPLQRNMPY
ncbi:Hypothetical predicted protein [Mytilus galloprovincialis]|uniref:Uncharacterized protein n=2 Tax=Mytilus galloprovincialis TaxID=29158 RepID=A0A8B6HBG8_MYTGA|nr:Hypothetical predicted protein [Mytilus galloprovincialis]